MAITARLLQTSTPRPNLSSSLLSNTSSSLRCLKMADKRICEHGETKSRVAVKASVASGSLVVSTRESQAKTSTKGIDLPSIVRQIAGAALTTIVRPLVRVKRRMSWKRLVELLIEKGIIDCRFFTLFAVGGSLLGSVLCFVEGFFLILESYLEYFQTMSKWSEEGHVMQLLIEAIDMFLLGSATLVFGIGMYVMFVGTTKVKSKSGGLLSGSNFCGLFRLKTMPAWMEMQSVSQAKTQIGRSVLMILQVGVLEKFKSVPLVTPFDLVCFAGAVVISSACIFLLSRLSMDGKDGGW